MRDFELTSDEEAYLQPILERRTLLAKAKFPKTLTEFLSRWEALILETENGYPNDLAEFANEVSCREIIERDIKPGAPESLVRKIDSILRPLDERYIAATGELGRAWFGNGDPNLWWWYRCPRSWYQYRQYGKADR